jgi:hypothetical protein
MGDGTASVHDVELFATGQYRGKVWTLADLDEIAQNAKQLGPNKLKLLTPPVVFGHEEEQQFLERTDWPAAGWLNCETVRVRRYSDPATGREEGILVGDLEHVPPFVAKQIEAKRYRKVSAEIYDDFRDDHGGTHGKALRRIAILGAEVPQVKRLADLPNPTYQNSESVRLRPLDAGQLTPDRTWICFAEVTPMVDRTQLISAITAAMPGISKTTLEALNDDQLADLAKNLPVPQQPTAPAAPALAPSPVMMAEGEPMSREEMVAALVEMGEPKEELDAMTDEEIAALFEELSAGTDTEPADAGGAVETMGDPATMTREELIAELTAAGQDAAALQALPDEELRAMYAQVMGAATATTAAPVAPAAPVMMSERRLNRKSVSEQRKLVRNVQRLNTYAEREYRRLAKMAAEAKVRDAQSFCEQLVRDGRATPAQIQVLHLPLLLQQDDTKPVHKFTENGRTRLVSAYELKKQQLAKMPKVIHFGERFPSGGSVDASQVTKDEAMAKARAHAELHAPHWKQTTFGSASGFVTKFSECFDKDPETALKMIS